MSVVRFQKAAEIGICLHKMLVRNDLHIFGGAAVRVNVGCVFEKLTHKIFSVLAANASVSEFGLDI